MPKKPLKYEYKLLPKRKPPSPEVAARRLTYPGLRERMLSLAGAQAALDHEILLALQEFDAAKAWEGWGSCVQYLEHQLGWSRHEARQRLRTARALERLPVLEEALAKGEVSYSKLRKVAPVCDAGNEEAFLYVARNHLYSQVAQLVAPFERALTHGTDEENALNPAAAAQRREAARRLTLRSLEGGLSRVEATLLDEELELIKKALDAQEIQRAQASEEGAGAEPDETPAETLRRLRIDRFLGVFESSLEGARESSGPVFARHEVLVHVTPADLERDLEREGAGGSRTQSGVRLSADAARRLACNGRRTDLLVEDLRLRTSEVLDVGRRARGPSTTLLRALWARDGGCRFPGCNASRFVDAHHVEHWADGGATKLANLMLLCRSHHRYLHEGGYSVVLEKGNAEKGNAEEEESFVFRDPLGLLVGEAQPVLTRHPQIDRELAEAASRTTPSGLANTSYNLDEFDARWGSEVVWGNTRFEESLERLRKHRERDRLDGWRERKQKERGPPAA